MRRGPARRGKPNPSASALPVVIVPIQTPEEIDRRRIIRELFHDSKATTVRVSRPGRETKQR